MVSASVTRLLSNTLRTLKAGKKHYQIVKDDKNLREPFHEAGRAMRIVEEALQAVRTEVDECDLAETPQNAMVLLEACNTKTQLFGRIFQDVAQAPEAERFEHYKTAVQQLGNGQTAEALVLEIMEDVCGLAENDTIKTEMEHHIGILREEINKLSEMGSSVSNQSSGNAFYAYGNSRQFNAFGGTQYNNSGSGHQFSGATFSGSVNFAKVP